jgi:hypothetical protein
MLFCVIMNGKHYFFGYVTLHRQTLVRHRLFVGHLFVWDTSSRDLPGISGSGGHIRAHPYDQGCPDYLTPGGANSKNFMNSGGG